MAARGAHTPYARSPIRSASGALAPVTPKPTALETEALRELTSVTRARRLRLARRHRVLAAVVVKPALGLPAQPASLNIFHQQRTGAVFGIRQPLVQHLHDG
jgi:hypothetical protein